MNYVIHRFSCASSGDLGLRRIHKKKMAKMLNIMQTLATFPVWLKCNAIGESHSLRKFALWSIRNVLQWMPTVLHKKNTHSTSQASIPIKLNEGCVSELWKSKLLVCIIRSMSLWSLKRAKLKVDLFGLSKLRLCHVLFYLRASICILLRSASHCRC